MRHPERTRRRPAAEALEARLAMAGHLTSSAVAALPAAALRGPGHVLPLDSPAPSPQRPPGREAGAALKQGTTINFINATGRSLTITVQSFPYGTPGTRVVPPGGNLPAYTSYTNPIPYYQLTIKDDGQVLPYYGPFGGNAYIAGSFNNYYITTTPPRSGTTGGGGGAGGGAGVQVETATIVNQTGHAVRLRLAGTLGQHHPTRLVTLRAGQAVDELVVTAGPELPNLTATFRGQAPVALPIPHGTGFPAPVDAIRQAADGTYSLIVEPVDTVGPVDTGGSIAARLTARATDAVLRAGDGAVWLSAFPYRPGRD